MDFDEDKIDEYTLALLYLVTHNTVTPFTMNKWGRPQHFYAVVQLD